MAKQKKKSSLNYIQRVLAEAYGVKSSSVEETKRNLQNAKEVGKKALQLLDIQDTLQNVRRTTANASYYDKITCDNDSTGFFGVVRTLLLGVWSKNRVLYTISKELDEYLQNDLQIQKCPFQPDAVFAAVCRSPILLEFLDGPIEWAFCASSSILSEDMRRQGLTEDHPYLITVYRERASEESRIICHRGDDLYTANQEECNANTIFRTLMYLGFVSVTKDGVGNVMIPIDRYGCQSAYMIQQIQQLDHPEFVFDPCGWMGNGLCFYMLFLTRAGMLDYTDKYLASNTELDNEPVSIPQKPNSTDDIHFRKVLRMVKEWEDNRIVYQFTNKTERKFQELYQDSICLEGFSCDLLNYFPHNTIALFQKDSKDITLFSPCRIRLEDGTCPGVFFVSIHSLDLEAEWCVFPASVLGASEIARITGTIPPAICALYHILTVLKHQTQENYLADSFSRGNTETTELALYRSTANHTSHTKDKDVEPVRQGASISDIPLNVFDVSVNMLKRAPKTQTEHYSGWHMVPHIRRRHPHRYWVGSGENRHMEVRWLEPMHINKSEETMQTTVKNLL